MTAYRDSTERIHWKRSLLEFLGRGFVLSEMGLDGTGETFKSLFLLIEKAKLEDPEDPLEVSG